MAFDQRLSRGVEVSALQNPASICIHFLFSFLCYICNLLFLRKKTISVNISFYDMVDITSCVHKKTSEQFTRLQNINLKKKNPN